MFLGKINISQTDSQAPIFGGGNTFAKPFLFFTHNISSDVRFCSQILQKIDLVSRRPAAAYAPFVTELNAIIKHYEGLIAQHLGSREAKKGNNEN
jgi:hypothetical protein